MTTTRKELGDALPVNEGKFEAVLEAGVGARWRREGSQGAGGGFRYLPPSDARFGKES